MSFAEVTRQSKTTFPLIISLFLHCYSLIQPPPGPYNPSLLLWAIDTRPLPQSLHENRHMVISEIGSGAQLVNVGRKLLRQA